MPSIDPERLGREIEALFASIDDPPVFRRALLDLLDFYADRTRRPGASTRADDVPWTFEIRQPLLHELSRALTARLSGRPDAALAIARELWLVELREPQVLAADALGCRSDRIVAEICEQWAPTCRDNRVLEALAGRALAGWRRRSSGEFLVQVERWMLDARPSLRLLALEAMRFAVEDASFERLPRVFRMLDRLSGEVRGGARRAFRRLVEALALRSSRETARFLIDELSHTRAAARLVRELLPVFDEGLRATLEAALSDRSRVGIMPAED